MSLWETVLWRNRNYTENAIETYNSAVSILLVCIITNLHFGDRDRTKIECKLKLSAEAIYSCTLNDQPHIPVKLKLIWFVMTFKQTNIIAHQHRAKLSTVADSHVSFVKSLYGNWSSHVLDLRSIKMMNCTNTLLWRNCSWSFNWTAATTEKNRFLRGIL